MNYIYGTALIFCILVSTLQYTHSFPASGATNPRFKRSLEMENPEDIFHVLMKLAQEVMESDTSAHSEKRGLDLGLSRGFSGSQAAKHLMGLAAANFANGPGRRRRDVESQ